jgi:phage terminase large subunit
MSTITRSNDDILLEQQNTVTELQTLNTNGAKEAKQDTMITDLGTIAGDTTSIDAKVSTEAKQDDIITAINAISGGGNKGNTGTESSVTQSPTSVTLLAANAGRKEVYIRNDASQILYVSLTATATTSSTIELKKGDIFSDETYTGIISGIWASGTAGAAQVTEITEV